MSTTSVPGAPTGAPGIAERIGIRMAEALDGSLRGVERPVPDMLRIRIAPRAVRDATAILTGDFGARFMVGTGLDRREVDGDFGVLHLFSVDRAHLYVVLDCSLPASEPVIDSITPLVPGAGWSEREFRDLVGIELSGHPDPRRLALPDDWPAGVHPLRRDVPYNVRPESVPDLAPVMNEPPAGASVLNLGPFFPVLEEPAQWRLFVEGETVVGADYRGFYNHRGIEKLGDSVLTYNEIPYLSERICGICGFIHSTCYCQAVEKAAEITVPPRARYIRTIMLELERVHSHLLWLGIAGHIIGFDTVLMQTWRIREPVMWLAEEISGNRKTYGMNTIGGVRRDLGEAVIPKILDVLRVVEKESLEVRDAIVGDTTLHARTRSVGVLSAKTARDYCVVGPPARGSGIAIDARIDHPYAAYDEVPVRIAVHEEGDTWSRVLVRVEELLESIRLVRECVAALPGGPVVAELREEIPAGRVAVSTVEAPRGEALHLVVTGENNRPLRWRVRAPTFPNLQALPAMVVSDRLADVPIALGSLDPCFSCTERMETIDVRSGAIRVYSPEELRRLSRAGGPR